MGTAATILPMLVRAMVMLRLLAYLLLVAYLILVMICVILTAIGAVGPMFVPLSMILAMILAIIGSENNLIFMGLALMPVKIDRTLHGKGRDLAVRATLDAANIGLVRELALGIKLLSHATPQAYTQ